MKRSISTVLTIIVASAHLAFLPDSANGAGSDEQSDQAYTLICTGLASRTDKIVSPIIRLRSDEPSETVRQRIGQAWKQYIGTTFPDGWETGCRFQEAYIEQETPGYSTNVGSRSAPVTQTVRRLDMPDGWYDRDSTIDGNVSSASISGHILIEDARPTQASPAELAEIRLQAQREDAARRAKAAAEHARTDAELQAKIKKFFEDAKKRGNAQ